MTRCGSLLIKFPHYYMSHSQLWYYNKVEAIKNYIQVSHEMANYAKSPGARWFLCLSKIFTQQTQTPIWPSDQLRNSYGMDFIPNQLHPSLTSPSTKLSIRNSGVKDTATGLRGREDLQAGEINHDSQFENPKGKF